MNIVKNNQRKNFFKKGIFSVCCLGVFAFLQTPYLNASKVEKGDIEINEPKEKPRKVNSNSIRACESESGCGGFELDGKALGVDVKVKAKKAGMNIKS